MKKEEDSQDDISSDNDFIFACINVEKEYSQVTQRSERNEYKISVETQLRDPVIFHLKIILFFKYSLIRKSSRINLKSYK